MKTRPYKVSLRGPYFPDIGGVSTHIDRLSLLLKSEGILNRVYSSTPDAECGSTGYEVTDTSWGWLRYNIFKTIAWYFIYGFRDRARIIHLHEHPLWDSPVLLLMLITGKKVVYTVHDQMMLSEMHKLPGPLVSIFKRVCRNKNIRWIAVNERIGDQLRRLAPFSDNVSVIPAYLEQPNGDESIEPQLKEFSKKHTPLLFIYAHHARRLNGEDLYGIDQALVATSNLKKQYVQAGLLVCIPNETPENLDSYRIKTRELGIADQVLFHLKPLKNVRKVMESSTVVLRPTLSDGDSMLVREALEAGLKVVASDASERPKGAIVYQKSNIDDLTKKIKTALSDDMTVPEKATEVNYYEKIRIIYDELTEGKCRD